MGDTGPDYRVVIGVGKGIGSGCIHSDSGRRRVAIGRGLPLIVRAVPNPGLHRSANPVHVL